MGGSEGCQEHVCLIVFSEKVLDIFPVYLNQILTVDVPIDDLFVGAAQYSKEFCNVSYDLTLPLVFPLTEFSPETEKIVKTIKMVRISPKRKPCKPIRRF